jgi:hypothetical protein
MRGVLIRMKDGHTHSASGYASNIVEKINAARGTGQLVAIERNIIPTGQMMYLDPKEVASIKDER